MTYNPYAAPAAEPTSNGDVPPRGEPQPWDVGTAIRTGWEIYKAHSAPLTFGYFVVALLGGLPGQVAPTLVLAGALEDGTAPYYAVHVPLTIVGLLLGQFFAAGFIRAALRALRTNDVSFGDFFAAGRSFLPFVVTSFLRSLATFLGLIAFVVPGIIVSLGFMNAPFFVVDQRLGPVEALKASWESSEGQKGNLFLLALAEVGLMLVGILACCLGLFVVVPVTMIAHAMVYTRMSGTAPPPVPPPGAYAPPPPFPGQGPGGYGPPGSYGQWGPPGA